MRCGRKDLRWGDRDDGGRAGFALSRQPIFDLQTDRRDVRQLLLRATQVALRQGALPERLRSGRNSGCRPLARNAATVWRNVTPTFIWKALHGEALPVENGGVASRDFIFVEDMARGLMACALRASRVKSTIWRPGSRSRSWSLPKRINRIAGNQTPIAMTPARDWDRSGQRFGDSQRKRERSSALSQTSRTRMACKRTIEWTREQQRSSCCMR